MATDQVEDKTCSPQMSRGEHMAWCKKRALELLDAGDADQAFASMASDLGKHPGTAGHSGIELGMMMMMSGLLTTPHKMREFIVGFN